MKNYFNIPILERLFAFKQNDPRKLGGHWLDSQKNFHYIPDRTTNGGVFGAGFQVGSRNCRWCEDVSGHFRETAFADKIIRLDHTGWYVDNFQNETTRGQVLQLPARNGKPVYMAACTDPCNNNCAIVEMYCYDDKDTAAREANRLAELYAEDARRDDLQQTAEAETEELKMRIENLRQEIRKLVAGIRLSKVHEVVCQQLRKDIHQKRQQVRSNLQRVEAIKKNPYILIEP